MVKHYEKAISDKYFDEGLLFFIPNPLQSTGKRPGHKE